MDPYFIKFLLDSNDLHLLYHLDSIIITVLIIVVVVIIAIFVTIVFAMIIILVFMDFNL